MRAIVATLMTGGAILAALPALAQDDMTGTGGGPDSTITAPYTRSTGQTVPSGRGDREMEKRIDERSRMERRDDVIDRSICRGC
jgi:hypothetical protein